ncbi:hypothetical protein [Clostridium sp. SM-530-WT-3G]|uniref:hypothetical protein n=1 Tax=Clostridium sp. SM-530-WT-3G TaxID=2725303 RepID=UPI00145F54CE|nr:hypothetical protein [Clostridium sp. SM-530-WT-3G]NME82030.1 hypothetical protein [Clostridium sp. SM-530-WT-3G]
MGIIIIALITAIVIWKSLYTIGLIRTFAKENNTKHKWINIIFMGNYIIYFYFLIKAAMGLLKSPLEGPLWLIILFVILILMNIYYDLKNCKFIE